MALALIVLGLHAYYYLPFLADDALISLRYAMRLADGQGLNWNTGERVEGYSNLLWVLCAAAMRRLGVDLITAVRALGVLGMSAAIAATVYAHPPRVFRRAAPVTIATLFLPLSAPIAVWTVGGMEQPLVAGLLAWAIVLCYGRMGKREGPPREMLLPGLLFALLCVTRLDGAVFTAAALMALFLIEGLTRQSLKRAFALGLLPFLFLAGQAAFRLFYYGEWVPNIALVKFVPSGKHALDGWGYVWGGALALSPLIILAAASIALSFKHKFLRPKAVLLGTLVLFWTAYMVLIGGDIFPGWRHFVPLIVLLVMLAMTGAEWVGRFASRKVYRLTIAAALVLLTLFVFLQFRDSENLRAKSERWEWDGQVIGTLLKKAFGAQQPLMAVDSAGCLPYWSELPSLDMLGLNDYYLPRHPPADLGQGAIGHELGDGRYVLDRRPDLVIFLLPTGNDQGYFLSGRQMQQEPRFYRDYTLVWFEGREPYTTRSRVWVRKHSERIGIRSGPERIDVPGFLFSGNPATITYLAAAGVLVVPATQTEPARISGLVIPKGLWRVEVDAGGSEAQVKVVRESAMGAEGALASQSGATAVNDVLLENRSPAFLDLRRNALDTVVGVEVAPLSGEVIEVRGLSFVRVQENVKK